MRTKNRFVNFILESSQILLVYLGIFSAIMCGAYGIEVTFNRMALALILLGAVILFYYLFTVLETIKRGKLYGILGITVFIFAVVYKFYSVVYKGVVTIVNSFLKEFMNSFQTQTALLANNNEQTSAIYCTTFVLVLVGVYIVVIISAFFYRKRRARLYIIVTLPFVIAPMFAGQLGYFAHILTYMIVIIAVIGTRHLKTDDSDRKMRQKLSLILAGVGLIVGLASYIIISPEKYAQNENRIKQTRNSIGALASWDGTEAMDFIKSYFSGDAISYGKIGSKKEINYTGKSLVKISGTDINTEHGLYLKGFVGDVYEDNKWTSLNKNDDYVKETESLDKKGISVDNWFSSVRKTLGDSETSDATDLWHTGMLRIRNIAFGYGNYLIPYLPANGFVTQSNGRSDSRALGIDYQIEYYNVFPVVMRQDLLNNKYTIARATFWDENKKERDILSAFVKKYYLQVPETAKAAVQKFKEYLIKDKQNLLERFQKGTANQTDMINAVREYIVRDTTYSLSPGKTPSDKDSVVYFLDENKKGYCIHYASAAAILLRGVGIPARYVEGMYVTKDELSECENGNELGIPDSDSHAWVEVYEEKYGFVPLEVTPGQGEQDSITNQKKESDEKKEDNGTTQNNDTVKEEPEKVTPTPKVKETEEESMEFNDIEGNEEPDDATLQAKKEQRAKEKQKDLIILICAVFVALLLAVEIQRRIRKIIFTRNVKAAKAKKRVTLAHRHLARLFVKKGVKYHGQSVACYAKEISEIMEVDYDEVYTYVYYVFKARFDKDGVTKEEFTEFFLVYDILRKSAYKNVKIFTRLYYMYFMVL